VKLDRILTATLALLVAAPLGTAVAQSASPPDPSTVEGPRVQTSPQRTRRGMDTLELGTTSITGNQELPKVMSIVPWKSAQPLDVEGRPADSLLDEVLSPIDRTEMRREIRYRSAFESDKAPE